LTVYGRATKICRNCRGGEIGRHAGFKIQWLHGRAGSIPALGTTL
jgi:hypothetical protein